MSAPSFAKEYRKLQGCFEKVKKISAVVRQYVPETVVGGQVCMLPE